MSTDPELGSEASTPALVRGLGAWDAALLTIGTIIGTGIFLTPGGVAAAVGSAASPFVWIVAGMLTLAGALAYAELGAMYPRAGGLYHFLKEAWGPATGFLYGWTCLLCIMSGGIAAIAVGFGEYLGVFLPWFASSHAVLRLGEWTVNGAQVAALIAIGLLTAVNHVGVREGARVQGAFTLAKLAAIAMLIGWGVARPSLTGVAIALPASPPGGWSAFAGAFGFAMIATLWTYDGWYALTFSAAEVKQPARNLPRGLLIGVGVVIVAYGALSYVYLRALPQEMLAHSTRVAEDAALALAGPRAARFMALAVVVSSFGCLAATILYSSRVYQPMAADGVFFRRVARIHPKYRTPVPALWLQSLVAAALTLSGSYNQLFTFVTFGGLLFHVMTGLALFRLRATRPDQTRPYRAWGYPLLPALFVLGMAWLTVNTLLASPRESLLGLGLIATGLPAYAWWRRTER